MNFLGLLFEITNTSSCLVERCIYIAFLSLLYLGTTKSEPIISSVDMTKENILKLLVFRFPKSLYLDFQSLF